VEIRLKKKKLFVSPKRKNSSTAQKNIPEQEDDPLERFCCRFFAQLNTPSSQKWVLVPKKTNASKKTLCFFGVKTFPPKTGWGMFF